MGYGTNLNMYTSYESKVNYGLELLRGDQSDKSEMVEEAIQALGYEGTQADLMRSNVAILLSNTEQYMQQFDETTKSIALANLDKYIFPLIVAVAPSLSANRMVSVQPMNGPQSVIFALDFTYGTKKGATAVGTKLFENSDPNYASEYVVNEVIATSAGQTRFVANLMWKPVRPGTVSLTDGIQIVTDNGLGGFIGNIGSGNNTIDYANGSVDVTFAASVTSQIIVEGSYEFDSEASGSIPEINAQITATPVTARNFPIRFRWSVPSAINAQASHAINLPDVMSSATSTEIHFEIDQKVIRDIDSSAPTVSTVSTALGNTISTTWYTRPASGSWVDQRLSILDWFTELSTGIEKYSGRGVATWFNMGSKVADIVSNHPATQRLPVKPGKGIKLLGKFNNAWDIYKDTEQTALEVLAGFKSDDPTNAAYVYAPFIIAMATQEYVLDDLIGRRALFTSYARKMVNAKMFIKGLITDGVQA